MIGIPVCLILFLAAFAWVVFAMIRDGYRAGEQPTRDGDGHVR